MSQIKRIATVLRNVASAAVSRGVNLAVAAAMVPLTVGTLTPGEYSILAVALSLSILASYADFGLGYAIVNRIATAKNGKQEERNQQLISTIWFALIALAGTGVTLTLILSVGVHYWAANELTVPITIAITSILAGLPTGVGQRILFAQQRGGIASAMASGSRIASLLWVYAMQNTGELTLLNCILGILGLPTVLNWVYTAYLFTRDKQVLKYCPRLSKIERRLLPSLFTSGRRFLVLQTVPYLESGADTVFLATIVGMSVVPAWDVHSRLFGYLPAITLLALFPLWPAVSKAASEQDYKWIATIRRSLLFGTPLVAGAIAYAIYANSQYLVEQWTGQRLEIDQNIVAAMALLTTVACTAIAQSTVLNGLNKIKLQSQINTTYIALLLPLKIVTLSTLGPVAMLAIATAAYLVRILATEIRYNNSPS